MFQFPRATWFLAIIATLLPVRRWGPDGHRIVADIALQRLSPSAADETRRLLGGQSIIDIASWADDARRLFPSTGPWHYVDIQLTDTSYVPSRDCKENACVVWALDSRAAILADRTQPDSIRATALKYIVHFVADLHQPLHGGERADKGGNDVKVTFNGRLTNLHSLWDSGLLLSYGQSAADVTQRLRDQIAARKDIDSLSGGTVTQWAMESHDVARDVVYRNLPSSLEITPEYAAAARPVVDERLLRAGIRLAALLERTLGTHAP